MTYHKEQEVYVSTRETVEQVKGYPIKAIPSRGITKATCEHFGVRVALSESDGETIEAIYFPERKKGELTGWQKKDLTKGKDEKFHFTTIGTVTKENDLFGQDVAPTGGNKSFIFEGKLDALAAWQTLKAEYPKGNPATVAVLGTSWAATQVSNNSKFFTNFKDTVLALDQDEATPEELKKGVKRGKEATREILNVLPNCLVAEFSEKDANDMILKGKEKDLYWALIAKAKPFIPEGIIRLKDVREKVLMKPTWGRKWPWPSLNGFTFGRRDGEGIYVGAAVKAGKTEFLTTMVDYLAKNEETPSLLFKFEQSADVSFKMLAGKRANKQFHNPKHFEEGRFTEEDIAKHVDMFEDKVLMFDASFSDVGKFNMWDRMKPVIRHAVVVEGVKDIFIDPITQLTDGMTPSDTETELRRFSNELQGMAQDLGFFYYCFAHLKEPQQGKTHEEGGTVKVAQYRGSRAMAEKTKFLLAIERNQTSSDMEIKNTSWFNLLLNSGFGKTGKFPVFYDSNTGSYKEPEEILGEEF